MNIFQKKMCYVYILNIFIHNINYMNINTGKYMYVCVFIYCNKHTNYVNKNFIFDAINHD